MKTILTVFGTRPEAIKMCPLIKELATRRNFNSVVCVTGQHRQMLDTVLDTFCVKPDYDLSVMREGQSVLDMTGRIMNGIDVILEKLKPDIVLVHGDTTTAFATALACFYRRIFVGHVEAGLRTYNIYSPHPEEFNRRAISIISKIHFAPTEVARENLLSEGIEKGSIYVTGNTVIDAVKTTVKKEYTHPILEWASDSRLVILTAHRRESLGAPMHNMLRGVKRAVEECPDVKVICPMHKNPIARDVIREELGESERIRLIEPLGVIDFHNFLARSFAILTDSGGIQEEAVALGKPTLVMRDTTERPEGIEVGTLKLVGTDEMSIYENFKLLLESGVERIKTKYTPNPFGDGNASRRIANILSNVKTVWSS